MTQENDRSHLLRKVLHELPRIKTGDGFEVRLRRRINQSLETASPRPLGNPSLAYSSIAVALIFVLFYYLFTESHINPVIRPPEKIEKVTRQTQIRSGEQATLNPAGTASGNETREPPLAPTLKRVPAVPVAPEARSHSLPTGNPEYNNQLAGSSPTQNSTGTSAAESQNAPPKSVSEGLTIDQNSTTTGILELKRYDTSSHNGPNKLPFTPRVRDALGVGVLGQGISSSLADSLRLDSLKKLKKQFVPKAMEKRPKE